MHKLYQTRYLSPVGEITIKATTSALVSVRFANHRHDPHVLAHTVELSDHDMLARAVSELDEYFLGQRTSFDMPMALDGTDFQKRVWIELGNIPYGTTISYEALAIRLGDMKAIRAAAAANGKNPISIIVPCHRVVAKSGALQGYGGGLVIKQKLLNLEGVGARPDQSCFEELL